MQTKNIRLLKTFGTLAIISLLFAPSVVLAQDTIELIVHYVEGTLLEEKVGYEVSVYLSALQANGSAIDGLTKDDFKITEDSQQVEIKELSSSSDLPMHLILLIDTSGSMQGTPIQDARKAASNFIGGLGKDDQMALAIFNEKMEYITDFADEPQDAKGKINNVDAVNLASTCLYDAAFSAVEKAATLESGRRAIILLTDGQDYKSGGACSVHTLDDVVDLASEGSTRVPVYTIGLGDEIDEKNLQRLSDMSGGLYHYAPSSGKLQSTFDTLSSQLRSQYVLTYTSNAAPGSHTIAVEMKYENQTVQDTRNFTLPELSIVLTLVSPSEGQEISGIVKFAASISGSGDTVEKIVYSLGDNEVITDTTAPYDLDYEFAADQVGSHILTAAAMNADGEVIAQDSVGIKVVAAAKQEDAGETTQAVKDFFSNPLYVGLAALGLVVLIAAVILIGRKRKKVGPVFSEDFVLREASRPGEDRTIDISLLQSDSISGSKSGAVALATLTILNSDDAGMVGQQLSITNFPASVGRSAKNNIVISKKDQPVSRDHIVIDQRRGSIILMEVISTDSSGNPKPPTYGTFVNEKKVAGENVLLRDGDDIRLGSRFRMRFITVRPSSGSEDRTLDGINSSGEDKTREIERDDNNTQQE